MNDETSNSEKRRDRRRGRLPGPIERVWFELQERLIWPFQDRFIHLGPGPSRRLLAGSAALAVLIVAGIAIVLSTGGSSNLPTTAIETATPSQPLAATTPPTAAPESKPEPPRETLHGAAPVFSPPSPASKGGEKTGRSKPEQEAAASSGGSGSGGASPGDRAGAGESSSGDAAGSESSGGDTGDSNSPSPAAATISSDPKQGSKADGGATSSSARASVPDGPPAGPAALKVAREFAKGFVVYETGGAKADFHAAFAASATPELTKALLQRPPKQPAGVKVPRAKVLNVVAGPSRGQVYEVSVSLLRVGVTSELRLDMEKVEQGKGKRVEWRVTNVLG